MIRTNDRLGLALVDEPAPAAPAKAKAKRRPKPTALAKDGTKGLQEAVKEETPAPTAAPKAPTDPTVRLWGTFGVAFMLVLSACLNGFANSLHAPAAWAGWLMGLSVPVIVLVLAKVAGEKWRKGERGTGGFAGGSGLALLLLSIWHCSESIAVLTGSPVALALPLALAIDAGLVACELAIITEPRG